jgi:hypothetical protein
MRCAEALRVAEQQIGRSPKCASFAVLPRQRGFGRRIAPRLVRDAAKRQTRIFDRPPSSSSAAATDTSANA